MIPRTFISYHIYRTVVCNIQTWLFSNPAIRVAARWYQSHLGGSVKVLLITNDRDNKRKAMEEGLNAETGG